MAAGLEALLACGRGRSAFSLLPLGQGVERGASKGRMGIRTKPHGHRHPRAGGDPVSFPLWVRPARSLYRHSRESGNPATFPSSTRPTSSFYRRPRAGGDPVSFPFRIRPTLSLYRHSRESGNPATFPSSTRPTSSFYRRPRAGGDPVSFPFRVRPTLSLYRHSRESGNPWTLLLGPLARKAKAFAFGEPLFFACARALQEQRRTAKPPQGRGTGMCRVKKSNQKKAHPACAPAVLLRVREAGGIFRRDLPAARPSPGHSPRGECPPAGAKRCFAFFRRAHARRPSGFSHRLRRFGGPRVSVAFVGHGGWRAAARGGVARSGAKSRATAVAPCDPA